MQKTLFRFFTKPPKRPSFLPSDHPNYNFEQYPEYTSKYKRALEQKQLMLKKLETVQTKTKKRSQIKKDTNFSIENYQVWRVFNKDPDYGADTGFFTLPDGKIRSTPKLLLETFGYFSPSPSVFPKSTACLQFQDRNLDYFYLYDVREGISKLKEIKTDLQIAWEFWSQDEEHEFWFSCSQYAEKYRFKKYILDQLQKYQNNEIKSFEERMNEFGCKIELYDNYDQDYQINTEPLIYRRSRSEFDSLGVSKMDYMNDSKYDVPLKKPEFFETLEGFKKFWVIVI